RGGTVSCSLLKRRPGGGGCAPSGAHGLSSRRRSAWHRRCSPPRTGRNAPAPGARTVAPRRASGEERRMRRSIAIAAGLALSLGTASLAAAEGEKETLSGQVTEKQGDTLTIRSATGGDVDVQTTGDTQVRGPQ